MIRITEGLDRFETVELHDFDITDKNSSTPVITEALLRRRKGRKETGCRD